jgi:hypothetical protein
MSNLSGIALILKLLKLGPLGSELKGVINQFGDTCQWPKSALYESNLIPFSIVSSEQDTHETFISRIDRLSVISTLRLYF